jgi:hypothetical protein
MDHALQNVFNTCRISKEKSSAEKSLKDFPGSLAGFQKYFAVKMYCLGVLNKIKKIIINWWRLSSKQTPAH